MNAPRPRVLLAEPDLPIRTGLKLVVERGGMVVAGEAADAAGTVALVVAERPDLALVAADLPGGAMPAIRRIAAGAPGTRVIVFTAAPSGDELLDAVLAGAVGYLSRDTPPERLPVVLRAVRDGEAALPRRLSRRLVDALRGREARRALAEE